MTFFYFYFEELAFSVLLFCGLLSKKMLNVCRVESQPSLDNGTALKVTRTTL